MTYVIASNNPKKVKELQRILKPVNVTVKTAAELGVELGEIEDKRIRL